MICENCKNIVDNDLVFCTECGSRLHETISEIPTVFLENEANIGLNQTEKKSILKWIVLLAALISIPLSIFGVYLLINLNKPALVTNVNKPKTPTPASTRKTNINTNINSNFNSNSSVKNSNSNFSNSNQSSVKPESIEQIVWNERIEIAPKTSYSVPFNVNDDSVIQGSVKLIEGSAIEGYVYTKEQFDKFFPNSNYKAFSIESEKLADIKQFILKDSYILVFVNDSENNLVIEGKITISTP